MGSAVQYDPSVIVEQANRLYRQAATIVVSHAILFGIVGAIVGGGASFAATRGAPSSMGVLATALVGSLIGIAVGRERAFRLRLQAQQALCQVQIEINTRPSAA